MFSVGDLVICVFDYVGSGYSWSYENGCEKPCTYLDTPHFGKIYTVSSAKRIDAFPADKIALTFLEVKSPPGRYFDSIHFRKVIDYKETMKKALKKDKPVEVKL